MKKATTTYVAVYKAGEKWPTAFFLDPEDARQWHDNPEVFSNARRRVEMGPPFVLVSHEPRCAAEVLLERIVNGSDEECFRAVSVAKCWLARQEECRGGKVEVDSGVDGE